MIPDSSRTPIVVRDARPEDRDVIIEFNERLAWETEAKRLDRRVLSLGVDAALADPDRLRYWLAESQGGVVGQTAATREWSDWRNGWIWWLQSVYVEPDARRLGVFRALHGHVRSQARALPDVIGLRLYVEAANLGAQRSYQSLGMAAGGYHVFEEIWLDRSPAPSGD